MKEMLRTLFRPLLAPFEKGTGPYAYRPLNRKLLIVMGILFAGLATGVYLAGRGGDDIAYLLPVLVFGAVALVCLVVGGLGNERAVSRIWGNR
ncbi:MAG: hypothetical protein WDA10_09830 [Porticoccaceae bacterium]|jgi:hypothetical protein|nr:hypothetical protein [Porticoccaceae bacterium]MEA3298720.1 hypothetical protein [Pseudomonadota bacterium]